MTDADRLRAELTTVFEMRYKQLGLGLGELAQNIEVSKTYLSLFLNGRLERPSPKLLARIRRFLRRSQFSANDERLFLDVLKLLERADDPDNIRAALALQ